MATVNGEVGFTQLTKLNVTEKLLEKGVPIVSTSPTISDGQIPKYDLVNEQWIYSGATSDVNNKWTFDNAINVINDTLTTNSLASFYSNSTDASSRSLVEIINDNTLAVNAIALKIQQDSDSQAAYFDANGILTSDAVSIIADGLTSGSALSISSNSSDSGTRNVIELINDNSASTGATVLYIQQDADNDALNIISAGIGINITGGLILKETTVNVASYSLLTTDSTLLVSYTSTGAVSITLPTAQTTNGRKIIIKDSGGNAAVNNITINTESTQTIDGLSNLVMNVNYQSTTLISDGSNWFII